MGTVQNVGAYELGPRLGSGGMADVFAARAPDGEIVALKVARPALLEQHPVFRDLFLAEGKIAMRLSHPNVVRSLAVSAGDAPEVYLAMELLLGRTLADIFDALAGRGEHVPWELAVYIACSVAEGLHHAHELTDEHGMSYELLHRDVNPSNIVLTIDGAVKVIDFGLARSRDALSTMQSGVVKGKVSYLAPEQLTRRAGDRRVDIYQLGITLWELRVGRRLYLRPTQAETIAAVREGIVPQPQQGGPGDQAIAAAIMRALEKNPDRRYTTMRGFARALAQLEPFPSEAKARLLAQDTMEKAFPGEAERLREWCADLA
jgi:eukaryotic-like serine/threonine-protein kinase